MVFDPDRPKEHSVKEAMRQIDGQMTAKAPEDAEVLFMGARVVIAQKEGKTFYVPREKWEAR